MRDDPRAEIPNLLLEGRGRRTLVRLGIAGGAALVIGIAVWLGVSRMRRNKLRRADTAFQALSTCLIGEPLSPGETIPDRLHRIELTRRHDPTLDDGGARWPNRCAAAAQAVYDGLITAGVAGDSAAGRLRDTAFGVAGILLGGKLPADPDALWVAARAADLPAGDPVRVRPPALPTHAALRPAQLSSAGTGLLELAATDQQAEALELLLSRGPDDLTLCRFGKGATATCAPVAAAVPRSVGNLGIIAGADDTLIALWGAGEPDGLYRAVAGTRVWRGPGGAVPLAGSAHGDDFTLLIDVGGKPALVRRAGGADVTLPLEVGFGMPTLLGGDLVWQSPDGAAHFFRRPVADAVAQPSDLGPSPSLQLLAAAGACRAGPAWVAAYRSSQDGILVTDAPALTPFSLPWAARYWLTCTAAGATFTWSDYLEVHQLGCAQGTCTAGDAAMAGVPTDASVTAVGARVVAIWSSDVELPGTGRDDEHGLLWLRSAPLADLARTPDTLLLEGGYHLRSLHPHAGNMVAVVTGGDGAAYFLLLDGQRGATPIRVTKP